MIKTVYVDVDVDVELHDFSDDELIEELESRGYNIDKEDDGQDVLIQDVIDWYKRGNVKEALYQLEEKFPELYGISDKI